MRRSKRNQGPDAKDAEANERADRKNPKRERKRRARTESPPTGPKQNATKAPHREIWYTRWLGLALCSAGFVAIALGWSGMSGAKSADAQLPYLLSGGATGLGLIIFGAALLVISQMRADRFRHEDALAELVGRTKDEPPAEESVSTPDRAVAAFPPRTRSSTEPAQATPRDLPAASGGDR